jgi:xylulose-5-phosphate/fructose-6-phosphate phosphoketolase
LKALAPTGIRRMSANPHANGGILKRDLRLPDFHDYAQKVEKPGKSEAENTRPLGAFLRDVMKRNMDNFRVFGPDETTSNKLDAIYAVPRSSGSKSASPRTTTAANWPPTAASWRC